MCPKKSRRNPYVPMKHPYVPRKYPYVPQYIPMCPNLYPSDSQVGRAGGKFSGLDRSKLREWLLLQQEPTNNRLRKPDRRTALPGSQKTPVFVHYFVPYENSCYPPYRVEYVTPSYTMTRVSDG